MIGTYYKKTVFLMLGLCLLCVGRSVPATAAPAADMLHLYALAFDSNPNSAGNLETYYQDVIAGFVAATADMPGKTIVALVDLHDDDDPAQSDHIIVIENGAISTMLFHAPLGDGTLHPTPYTEYDMTDAQTVGGFVLWARSQFAATRTIFSFVGHGTFDPSYTLPPAGVPIESDSLDFEAQPVPLPWNITPSPDYTDEVTGDGQPDLLTPQVLAAAMSIATDNGNNPLDVLDVVHCFAGSAEQLYELSNPGGTPFAKYMVTSPNYTYFSADMLTRSIERNFAGALPETLARNILWAYTDVLDEADLEWEAYGLEHPYSMSVTDSSAIPALKTHFDQLATQILARFATDAADTAARLQQAQSDAAIYYDTSLCTPGLALNEEDALVDIGRWAEALLGAFSDTPSIAATAQALTDDIDNAVVLHRAQDGRPFFAGENPPYWQLEAASTAGISAFVGIGAEIDEDGVLIRPWQSNWYTTGVEGQLAWLAPSASSANTWADVITVYWQEMVAQGKTLRMGDECLPELELVLEDGDITAVAITLNDTNNAIFTNTPLRLSGIVENERPLNNVLVTFNVLDATETAVFSTTVSSTNLEAGQYQITANDTWTITEPAFTVQMFVDANHHVIETDETDNIVQTAAITPQAQPDYTAAVTLVDDTADHTVPAIDLHLTMTGLDQAFVRCTFLRVDPNPAPLAPVPVVAAVDAPRISVDDGANFACSLPNNALAGAYQLLVEVAPTTGGSWQSAAALLAFNYNTPSNEIAAGDIHLFTYDGQLDDLIAITTQANDQLVTNIWEPGVLYPTYAIRGAGTRSTMAQTAGQFVVSVYNPCRNAESYQLTAALTQINSAAHFPVSEGDDPDTEIPFMLEAVTPVTAALNDGLIECIPTAVTLTAALISAQGSLFAWLFMFVTIGLIGVVVVVRGRHQHL